MHNHRIAATAFACSLALALSAQAITLTEVPRATWAGNGTFPSYVKMYVYVPTKLAAKPPLVVSNHSCGSTAAGQVGSMTKFLAAADKNGFIMIFPDNPGQNCWDVGSKASMTHDGGSDPHAVAQMVRYALTKYQADSSRVYVLGGSSGGMMTQALLGVYPELFAAGAPRAGVPCGCWTDGYATSNQWSSTCATGKVSKTAQDWGDYIRAINPNYTGHRPRVQLFHGDNDQTISYNNLGEAIKEWTNTLKLGTTPTTTDKITSSGYSYNRQAWKNACGYTVLEAWTAPGQGHSMTYEEDSIIKFFGLQVAGGRDPEPACPTTGIATTSGPTPHGYSLQGRQLVLDATGSDAVEVRLQTPSGQMVYRRTQNLGGALNSITIPFASLQPGHYLASVVRTDRQRQIRRDNFQLVVIE